MKNQLGKGILFFLCSFFAISVQAQVKVAIFGGPQISTASYKINKKDQPAESKYGAQLGAMLKVPFENQLYFTPAVYYSMKGYKVTLNQPSFPPSPNAINNDTRIHTIETAALLNYDFTSRPSHFFVRWGFSVDANIKGSEKFDLKNGGTTERDMKFSFNDYGYLTASANVQFGYESKKGLMIFSHYEHGLGSLNNADLGPKILHRVAGISLGYYLGKK